MRELAPAPIWRPAGCCGIAGPIPSATLNKVTRDIAAQAGAVNCALRLGSGGRRGGGRPQGSACPAPPAWKIGGVPNDPIALEGAWNFRDLGGLPAGEGRRTACGLVYRADRLTGLSEADVATLEALGIERVFDLRSDLELAANGPGPFASRGDRHRHVPLVTIALSLGDDRIDWSRVDLSRRYLEMLEQGAAVIRGILSHLATDDAPPTVFHCTGGKDRTGVVAAVLLRLLGVPDDAIVEDYAVSERNLAPFVAASRAEMERQGHDPAIVLYLCGSPPERMRSMLAGLDARWGGIEGYLDWIGLERVAAESLRARLLVPTVSEPR